MMDSFHSKLETLYHISHSFVTSYDLNTVLTSIINEIEKLNQFDLVCIYMLEGNKLYLKRKTGSLSDRIIGNHSIEVGEGIIGRVVKVKEPLLVNNLSTFPNEVNHFQVPIQSQYCIPLIMNQQPLGAIYFGSKQLHAFSQDDVNFLLSLATSSTIAIYNAINYNILHAISRITTVTSRNREVIHAYPELVEELLKVMRFDGLKITFPHPFRIGEMICFPIYLNREVVPLMKKILPLDGSATKGILKKRIPQVTNQNEFYNEDQFTYPLTFKTTLRIPFIVKGRPIGVIHIYSERENAYNEWEIETISQLILQLSPSLDNIIEIVYQSEVRRIKKVVKQLSTELGYTDQLEQTLLKNARLAKRYLHYSEVYVWLLDQERLTLKLLNQPNIELAITDNSIIVRSFMEKQTLAINESFALSDIHPKLGERVGKSGLMVPLCDEVENQCVGVFLLIDRNYPIRFSQESIYIANEYIRPLGTHILRHLKNAQLEKTNLMMIQALTVALDKKDAETQGHSRRVTSFSLAIAKRLNVNEALMKRIQWGALLHDIGKIGIPDAILLKPGKLTDEEWKIMKQHPQIGYEMIQNIEFLEGAVDVVLYHHEHFDGKGYPFGLVGEEIPLPARIFAIADAFDAITSKRPYKEPKSIEFAREVIKNAIGSHFCPMCAQAFLEIPIDELKQIQLELNEKILAKSYAL
ncbi:cyclic di-GMP phosphodiesterase response regulator RpfG [Tepidibacillus sp. HK-1]|nr:cyclic di-GMP phosphodiesterase response regulator RpfG [Tepidibacillus sp. HK-1]